MRSAESRPTTRAMVRSRMTRLSKPHHVDTRMPSTSAATCGGRAASVRASVSSPRLSRKEVLGGKAADLTISFAGQALVVNGARDSAELRAKLGRMFQFGVDTSEFVTLARQSPDHAWVERAGFGRLLCGATLFEDVAKIIATTN